MAAREGLVRYKRKADGRAGIRPDRHIENRSDIFASMTALVGTSGAMVGDLTNMPVLYVLDPAAGIVISAFVLRMGYRLTIGVLRTNDKGVLGAMDQQSLLEAVQRIDGVVAVDQVRARELGHYIALDVAIRVNPRITVSEGQDIAMRVRRQIMNRFLHISDACVQVQPYDSGYPYKSNHQEEEIGSFLQ
jgi:divalent metal cation (Fe/Co/Zn/Cd) transporter